MNKARLQARGRLFIFAVLALAGTACSPPVAEVVLTAREFNLQPETVTVQTGQTVRLVLDNRGVLAHNIAIEALDLTTETIQSGNEVVLEFTAPAAGTYDIVCTVPGHKEAGMRATLIVE